MKTRIRQLTMVAAVAALLAGAGCQSVSTTAIQYVGGPSFAPTDPANIAILRTEPTRPHIRLGEIEADPSSTDVDIVKIETALRQRAAKMGADAVVIVLDRVQVTGAQVVGGWYNRSLEETQGRVVIGVAIRYKQTAN